jgi:hypothetical protein
MPISRMSSHLTGNMRVIFRTVLNEIMARNVHRPDLVGHTVEVRDILNSTRVTREGRFLDVAGEVLLDGKWRKRSFTLSTGYWVDRTDN